MSDTTVNMPGDRLPSEPRPTRHVEQIEGLTRNAIALYIGADEKPIIVQLSPRERAHLGRYLAAFSAQPLIDLTPYGAFEQGVSRMHAAVQRTEDGGLVVEDLDSSNGTYLNGVRLLPHTATPLMSGDSLRLSNLPIQIFFAPPAPQVTPDAKEPISGQPQSSDISTSTGVLAAAEEKLSERVLSDQPGDKLPDTQQLSPAEPASAELQASVVLKDHTGAVHCIAFSSDGKHLASAGADGIIRVWETTTGTALATLKGHTGAVHSVVFSPDGKQLASAGADGTVRLWNISPLLLSSVYIK